MCSSILGCRHVPDSGGEDVSAFGSSGAEHFDGMAQECVRWLPGCIGPRVVADPGSVTTVTRLTLGSFWPLSFALRELGYPCSLSADIPPPPARGCTAKYAISCAAQRRSERRSGDDRTVGIDHHANQLAHSRQSFDTSPRGRCRLEAAVVGWMESGNDVRAIPA